MAFPVLAYEACIIIYDSLGEAEKARAVADAAHRKITECADRISNVEWRKSFLENVPWNRTINGYWERLHQEVP